MFWSIVGSLTFFFALLEMHRIAQDHSIVPSKGLTKEQTIIVTFLGRVTGDFLWIVSITWIVSLLIKTV